MDHNPVAQDPGLLLQLSFNADNGNLVLPVADVAVKARAATKKGREIYYQYNGVV